MILIVKISSQALCVSELYHLESAIKWLHMENSLEWAYHFVLLECPCHSIFWTHWFFHSQVQMLHKETELLHKVWGMQKRGVCMSVHILMVPEEFWTGCQELKCPFSSLSPVSFRSWKLTLEETSENGCLYPGWLASQPFSFSLLTSSLLTQWPPNSQKDRLEPRRSNPW